MREEAPLLIKHSTWKQIGQVALKALSLGQLEDIKKVELFQREVETLQQLSHPAIPKYLDCFTSGYRKG